jgi:hypothetical protein
MLCEKNRLYGDSALDPARVFSRSDAVEQIRVRIDDKLSRLRSGQTDDAEDAEWDLLGYLVLLRIAKRRGSQSAPETTTSKPSTLGGVLLPDSMQVTITTPRAKP